MTGHFPIKDMVQKPQSVQLQMRLEVVVQFSIKSELYWIYRIGYKRFHVFFTISINFFGITGILKTLGFNPEVLLTTESHWKSANKGHFKRISEKKELMRFHSIQIVVKQGAFFSILIYLSPTHESKSKEAQVLQKTSYYRFFN